jgi:phosphoribulokinase
MPRPLLLGIVGDSAAGKTTFTRGLVRVLGEAQATHISGDHYQRYDREQRAENGITPLHPDGNHLDVLEQHLLHLRAGEPILKPVYRHRDGAFGAGEYVVPTDFTIVEAILGFHTAEMYEAFDVRVFLDPPEDLRRRWKVQRDCTRRGYTTDQVLDELDRREGDAERFVRPQRRHADIVVAFMPGDRDDDEHLDAKLTLRPELVHPDLSAVLDEGGGDISLTERGDELLLWIAGTISAERSAAIEEAIWDRMRFADHLRTERLGEFTIGTRLHRSETLAIAQLLVLYQAVTGRAAIAIGGGRSQTRRTPPPPVESGRPPT